MINYRLCMLCGCYTAENEAVYAGATDQELWICPDCQRLALTGIGPENIGMLWSGVVSLKLPIGKSNDTTPPDVKGGDI